MSRHPIVNGRETTFVALAEKLGRELSCVRRHYRKLEQEGLVTMHDLRAPLRAALVRARRDAAISMQRHDRGRALHSLASKHDLSVQRIQQIAGSLQS